MISPQEQALRICGRYPQAFIIFVLAAPVALYFTCFAQRVADEEGDGSKLFYFYLSTIFETLLVVQVTSRAWSEEGSEYVTDLEASQTYKSEKPARVITLRSLFPLKARKSTTLTKWQIAGVVSVIAFEVFSVFIALSMYSQTGRGIQKDLLIITVDHPMYAVSVGSHNKNSANVGVVLFGVSQFLACLFILNKFYTILDPHISGKWLFIATVIFFFYVGHRASGHMSPGLQVVDAVTDTLWTIATRVEPALHDTFKADPSKYIVNEKRPKINVLLMINESINRRVLYTAEGKKIAPNYHKFVQEQTARGNIFDFPYATSPSATTEVSINSVAQGLYPTTSLAGTRPNPSLYYYAAENCFNTTALYSAHTLSFGNMDTFLVDSANTRIASHRGALNSKVVQDFCMDDRELLQYIRQNLLDLSGGVPLSSRKETFNPVHVLDAIPPVVHAAEGYFAAPWFAVFHSCGTHLPGHMEESDAPFTDQWHNALYRWDAVFGELLQSLDLSNTVLMLTSDHGHNPDDPRKFSRSWSFRPGDIHVPFLMYIPPKVFAAHPEYRDMLERNAYRSVTPVDLYPTLTTLFRTISICPHDSKSEEKPEQVDGVDLLKADAGGHRHILTTNTGVFRTWSTAPFALTQDHMQLIWDDERRAFYLYDIVDYTGEDMWPSLSHGQHDHWIRMAKSHANFLEILMKAGAE